MKIKIKARLLLYLVFHPDIILDELSKRKRLFMIRQKVSLLLYLKFKSMFCEQMINIVNPEYYDLLDFGEEFQNKYRKSFEITKEKLEKTYTESSEKISIKDIVLTKLTKTIRAKFEEKSTIILAPKTNPEYDLFSFYLMDTKKEFYISS
jgi:hypothetical protein